MNHRNLITSRMAKLVAGSSHNTHATSLDVYQAADVIVAAILLEKEPAPTTNEPKRYRCGIIIHGRRLEGGIVNPFEHADHVFIVDGERVEFKLENDHRDLRLDSLKVVGAARLERVVIGMKQDFLSTPSTRYRFSAQGALDAGMRCCFTIRCDKALEPPASSK